MIKKQNLKKIIISVTLLFISINTFAFENNQDIINVVKPGTVNIVSDIKGTIVFPNIIFDYKNNTIGTTTNNFSTTTINNSAQGTGFIISSDGIIVTHSNMIVGALNAVYRSEAKKYLQNINIQDQQYNKVYETMFNYLKENSVQNIEQNIRIVKQNGSYPANVFYTKYNFENDDAVGLLKIEMNNLPSIPLSDNKLSVGQNIYSISYSLFDELVSESVFNQGIVNSVKNNIYQTNMPSSEGSLGSPVIDKDGKIVGLLDLSGVVIPSLSIKEALATTSVTLKTNPYTEYYKNGLIFLENNRCKSALAEFNKMQDINPEFSITEYVKSKVDECNTIITAGESRDTLLDEIIFVLKYNISNSHIWLGLILLFLLLIIFDKYFINRFRRDEEKIKTIFNDKDKDGDFEDEIVKEKEITTSNTSKVFTEIVPFETTVELNPVLPSHVSGVKFIPLEKVEVTPQPESPHAPVTPPKAIQTEGPVVVITPFKTLDRPIKSLQSNSTELKKNMKTDLPSDKKNETFI